MASRSNNLKLWIQSWDGDADAARENVRFMPVDLLEELYREALEYRELQLAASASNSLLSRQIIVERYLAKAGVVAPLPLELPLFSGAVASPHIFNIGTLFGVLPNGVDYNAARPYMRRLPVDEKLGTRLFYVGERLVQSDLDVWMVLFDEGRSNVGGYHTLRTRDILRRLNLTGGGRNYTRLRTTIERLRTGTLFFDRDKKRTSGVVGINDENIVSNSLNLIAQVVWEGNHSVTFMFDRRMYALFDNKQYGITLLDARLALKSGFAKLLLMLFTMSGNYQHHRVASIIEKVECTDQSPVSSKRKLSRADCGMTLEKKIGQYARNICNALQELCEHNLINAFWISRPPRGKARDKIFVIWKHGSPTQKEPVPNQRGTLYLAGKTFLSDEQGNLVPADKKRREPQKASARHNPPDEPELPLFT